MEARGSTQPTRHTMIFRLPSRKRRTHWLLGRPHQPQLRARHLGIVGRQFLVWWDNQPERHTKPCDQTDKLAHRRHRRMVLCHAPVAKVSYSGGTYVRFGGNYHSVQAGWQYSWLGWPRYGSTAK